MNRYLQYILYVMKHKWYVFLECVKRRLFLRGLLHDLDKLHPSLFIPYARFFYNPDGTKQSRRDATGFYKPTATSDIAFEKAWFLHQARGRHH